MLVRTIMTKNFETASRDQTLHEVVEAMLKNDVDHIVVIEDETPSAIITQRKALIASYKTDAPMSEIPVSGFNRGLDTVIGPKTSLLLAVGKMQTAEAQCIPVVDGMTLKGILTKSDVIDNVSKITDDVLDNEQRPDEMTYV
jgi:CIC family chloride channel protein